MAKMTSAEYRKQLHPHKQALLNQLERDPQDGSQSAIESLDDVIQTLGNAESGIIAELNAAKNIIGTQNSGLIKDVESILDALNNEDTGVLPALAMLLSRIPSNGEPKTVAVFSGCKTSEGDNDEITWTRKNPGEAGNGYNVQIKLSDVAAIEVEADATGITVLVPAVEGVTTKTATDVVNAVTADQFAGDFIQCELTGSGGIVQNMSDPIETKDGSDITPGQPGEIRYGNDKLWISIGESTIDTSYWKSAPLTDPNE